MNQKNYINKSSGGGGGGGQNGETSPTSSFVMSSITEVQVSRLFSSLKVQNSALDVPNKLIKIVAELLCKPPAHLYNHLITTGIGLLFSFSAFCGIFLKMVVTTSKAKGYPIPWLPRTYFFYCFHSHMQRRICSHIYFIVLM